MVVLLEVEECILVKQYQYTFILKPFNFDPLIDVRFYQGLNVASNSFD